MIISVCELQQRRTILCDTYDYIKECVNLYRMPEEDKEDLMQDVYIIAYKKIGELRDIDKLHPWIRSIACNEWIRSYKKRSLISSMEISLESIDCEGSTTSDIHSEKVWKHIDELISKDSIEDMVYSLKFPASQIILLHFKEGYSLKEISRIMDMNYNTVKSIEARSLKRLRIMVAEKIEREK